jgi:hypothetical protein
VVRGVAVGERIPRYRYAPHLFSLDILVLALIGLLDQCAWQSRFGSEKRRDDVL